MENDKQNKGKGKKPKGTKTDKMTIVNKKISKDKEKKEKIKIPKVPKANKHDLEENFDFNGNYFYQKITEKQWHEIDEFFKSYITNKAAIVNQAKVFLDKFPNLKKGEDNIYKLKKM